MPTSYLSSMDFDDKDSEVLEDLKEVDITSVKLIKKLNLLIKAAEVGDVFIITNSVLGWIQFSAKKFMPLTLNFIETQKPYVISARHLFGNIYPNNPKLWKSQAYLEVKKYYNSNVYSNLFSFSLILYVLEIHLMILMRDFF